MSFDHDTLARMIRAHSGPVCRVVVVEARGSTPREAGAAMLVWAKGQHGTIGGGALEFDAALSARRMLEEGRAQSLTAKPLGPALGQCCGGAVTLLWEVFKSADLPDRGGIDGFFIRPASPDATPGVPPALLRQGRRPEAGDILYLNGWVAERLIHPGTPVWIHGGGHVGRALAATLAPLPDFDVTLIDTSAARLPDPMPEGVTPLVAANPVHLLPHAPGDARHLIMTFSHELDLNLCHALLGQAGASAPIGLVGSRTKWARFRKRLGALGHDPAMIDRIVCPIGDPALGKHPQEIAIGVAATLIRVHKDLGTRRRDNRDGRARQTVG